MAAVSQTVGIICNGHGTMYGKASEGMFALFFSLESRNSKTVIKTKTAPCISENKGLFLFLFGVFLSFHSQAQDSNQKYVFKTVIK